MRWEGEGTLCQGKEGLWGEEEEGSQEGREA